MLLESFTARLLADWAFSHFKKYGKAPNKEIEAIFFKKAREGFSMVFTKEIAEEIEEDILPDLSDESVHTEFDLEYMVSETLVYLRSRQILIYGSQLTNIIENGKGDIEERIKQADNISKEFKIVNTIKDTSIDLSKKESRTNIKKAFCSAGDCIVHWPKQLGRFWNDNFVAGGFLSILATEKRGKTFWLLEIAIRAARQGRKVAFFQAGDMNEAEQLKRIGVYLCKRSNLEKYCSTHWEPVRDCILNQMDECGKSERECDYGIFQELKEDEIRKLGSKELIEAAESVEDYLPCYNCKDYDLKKLGAPYVRKVRSVEPLEWKDVDNAVERFFRKFKRSFKLDTSASGTLSIDAAISKMDAWQEEDGFVADVVLFDYADLLVPSIKTEFRHQQNQIWKDLRKLSQTKREGILPLVISPTQADAPAYKAYRLSLANFSEDKRKYGHVTAMWGLNQDPLGREKGIGLMRINELIKRDGDFCETNEITVLQNLRQGRPFKGSYF